MILKMVKIPMEEFDRNSKRYIYICKQILEMKKEKKLILYIYYIQ